MLSVSDYPRFVLNRSVAILVYKQPFLDWLSTAGPDPLHLPLTLEDLRDDNDAFLIPQFDDSQDSVKWIEKRWRVLFDSFLFDWITEESMWPQNRTLKMFREWFDIEVHSMVWDFANESLLVEDWGDDDEAEDPNRNLH